MSQSSVPDVRVFVSSTVQDLEFYRHAAQQVILEMGWRPVLPIEQRLIPGGQCVERCLDTVCDCHLFLLLVGFRCGWIPSVEQGGNGAASITELELGTWLQAGRLDNAYEPIIFVAGQDTAEIGEGEDDLHTSVQTVFRAKLKSSGSWIHTFEYVPRGEDGHEDAVMTFASLLRAQLANVKAEMIEDQFEDERERRRAALHRFIVQERRRASRNSWVAGLVGAGITALLLSKENR